MTQARRFVSDALIWYGEQCVIRLKWRPEDFDAGLCLRCTACNDSPNPTDPSGYQSVLARLANAYKQPGDWWCSVCNGTGFVGLNNEGGGFKPYIYQSYMIATDTPEVRKTVNTFRFWQENPNVTFYPVPTIKEGDLIIRIGEWDCTNQIPLASSERFEAGTVTPRTMRTGPGNSITPSQQIYNANWPILIGQTANLYNLPVSHPFYQVEFFDPNIETINVQMNPSYHPHL